ncbi:hypothetical protein P7H12_26115 [Paenibacillus larvae]|nr:hypothetical protein [Paenibacillus larvae]MDT2266388.1 hypothetical protein [Paenibacillus larvae]
MYSSACISNDSVPEGYRIYYRKLSWAHLQKVSGFSVWRNADIFGRQRKGPLGQSRRRLNGWYKKNRLHIINYESALGNAYRGDAFYKVRYSQHYDGFLDESIDPYRVIIRATKSRICIPGAATDQ